MAGSRYWFGESEQPHFLTASVLGWLPQVIESREMLVQKMEYIHQNPVKRGYVDKPDHWRWSSAGNYAGMKSPVQVFMDW